MRRILTLFALFASVCVHAQDMDHIYLINNSSMGEFYFAKVHIETGELTNFDLAFTQLTNNTSVSTNDDNGDMIVCTGDEISIFETSTETVGASYEVPLTGNNGFIHTHYNKCDSTIYGLEYLGGDQMSFSKFHLPTQSYENLNTVSNVFGCYGCMTMLDAEEGQYILQGFGLHIFDIETGELIQTSPILTDPNYVFGHLSMHCETKKIYGTNANITTEEKSLGAIDSQTGGVFNVSNDSWSEGFYKPAGGGNDIDYTRNQYVYSGAGGTLVFVDIETGILSNSYSFPGSEFYFVQHFSSCECPSTVVPIGVNEISSEVIRVGPNPVLSKATFFLGEEIQNLTIYDGQGKFVLTQEVSGTSSIDLSEQVAGLLYWTLKDKKGFIQSGSLMKR